MRTHTAGIDQGETSVLRVFQSRAETRAFYNKISKVYDLLAEKVRSLYARRDWNC